MSTQTWDQVHSQSLAMDTSLTIVSPDTPDSRLLILLHGLTGNHMQWMRVDLRTLADEFNVTCVLPDGQRSFWIDQAHGLPWGRWVGQELPALLHRQLTLAPSTLIGGLSMGGYGAMRAAFDYPENFDGAFSLSGTLDVTEEAFRGRHPDLYHIGFGNPQTPRDCDDLVSREAPTMALYACCGEQDRLLDQNLRFRSAHPSIDWGQGPGAHNFDFWRGWLPTALQSMPQ